MLFQNESIATLQLPQVESVELHPIDRKELMISMGWSIVMFSLLLVIVIGLAFWSPLKEQLWSQVLVFMAWGLLAGLSILSTWKGFSNKKYALRTHDILYKKGWLWQSTIVIPFNRIQHASISQGPMERRFHLSSLHIYTAGGSSSDLSIPGLNIEEAQRIKDFILKQSGATSTDDITH